MSAVRGKPTLYVYRECNSNSFGIQVYGSGSGGNLQYKGQTVVVSPAQVSVASRIALENNDVLSQASPQSISFALNVNNSGYDGFKFVTDSSTANPCLKVTLPAGGQILAGASKTLVTNSINGISLATLGACEASPSPSPSPSPTPAPTPTPTPTPTPPPTSTSNIPMTSLEWRTEYDGYGFVNYDSTNQSVVFAPMASTRADETHATLLLSKRHLTTPLKNFRMTIVATTEQQLRTPTPNAWECFWIFYNYVYDANGKKITNYFTMKPNGIELGRAHDELGQNFLATATSPLLQIGLSNTYVIEKIGGKLTVTIDGRSVMNYDSATGPYPLYDFAGTIGLYSEDARVRVHSVIVEPR
jgi:hypothetical protein